MAEVYEDCNSTVAHLRGVRNAVKDKADEGAAKAKSTLARRRDTGASYIDVTPGDKLDYFLNLNDPNGGAMSIEFGRTGSRGKGGPSQGVFAITGAF